MQTCTIACIGCGNMGGAMLGGWLSVAAERGYALTGMTAVRPRGTGGPALVERGLTLCETAAEAAQKADMIVLSVKPPIRRRKCWPAWPRRSARKSS